MRILENHVFYGQVRSVGQVMPCVDGRKSLDGTRGLVTEIHNPREVVPVISGEPYRLEG